MIHMVQGDCIELLRDIQDESVDLVLTDPPYEISRDTNFRSGEATGKDTDRFRVSMDFGYWDKDFVDIEKVINECYRILKKGGTMICFYDLWKITHLKEYFEKAKFKQIRFIEWLKTNPVPINSKLNYLTNSREIAVCGVKGGNPTFHSEYDNGIYHFPICHGKHRIHPTQKPLGLIEAILKKHSNEGDLVVDCFMGSGVTGVACLNTGRRFIGMEIDGTCFDNAKNWIEKARKEVQNYARTENHSY